MSIKLARSSSDSGARKSSCALLDLAQRDQAAGGDGEQVAAAVAGVAQPGHVPVVLEHVHDADQVAGVEVDAVGHLALRGRPEMVQHREHAVVWQPDVPAPARLVALLPGQSQQLEHHEHRV
jgi:hypothetical protein